MDAWMIRAACKTLHHDWEPHPDLSKDAQRFIDGGGHTVHDLLDMSWSWKARASEMAETASSSVSASRAARWAQRAAAAWPCVPEGKPEKGEAEGGRCHRWPLMEQYLCRYGASIACSKVSQDALRELQDETGQAQAVGCFGSLPESVAGVLVWAQPACAQSRLQNAHQIRGNIAVIMRSEVF